LPAQAPRHAHPLTLHVGAPGAPQPQRFRVAPELDADLLEDRLGIVGNDLDRLAAEQIDRGELAPDVGQFRESLGAYRPARLAAAAGDQTRF
jgi:hypothetical protein